MKRIMCLLALFVMIFPVVVCSADREERVVIRDGYDVPDGKLLMIDDVSIQCAVHLVNPAPVNSISIPTVNAILLITTPNTAKCRESLVEDVCPEQNHLIGVGTSEETLFGFGDNCSGYCPVESIVGRQTSLVAYEGAKLEGYCRWGYSPATDGPDLFLSSRILTGMGRLIPAPNK